MNIPRSITIPAVVGVTASLGILAYILTGWGICEFNYAIRTIDRKYLPLIADIFKTLYPYYWTVPCLFLCIGIPMVMKKECKGFIVAWYIAVGFLTGMLMATHGLLTWYFLATSFRA